MFGGEVKKREAETEKGMRKEGRREAKGEKKTGTQAGGTDAHSFAGAFACNRSPHMMRNDGRREQTPLPLLSSREEAEEEGQNLIHGRERRFLPRVKRFLR